MSKSKARNSLPEQVRPVHPRAVRTHGFFGWQFVRQHMLVDERWTPASLTSQFYGMSELLARRLIIKRLSYKIYQKRVLAENKRLRHQIADGYIKLNNVLFEASRQKVRNELINHKDMQRLYQKQPIEMVAININQRTFVMRKERDRLAYRMQQLKGEYSEKLLTCGYLGNRIKYQNEFVLEEEMKARAFYKKIENSNIRLKGVKTINATYRKMVQILQHDGIFYEPILRSLSKDIEDQTAFIKHVLFLGLPSLSKFKQLSEEFRKMEDRTRKSLQEKIQQMSQYRRENTARYSAKFLAKSIHSPKDLYNLRKRFVRETTSMQMLKMHLENIENTIKDLKAATICSEAKEMFPRIKKQVEINKVLRKGIQNQNLAFNATYIKNKRAQILEGVLLHNLTAEETQRIEHIKALRNAIRKEDEKERKTVEYMKNRADAFVAIRHSLWAIHEIVKYVDKPPRSVRIVYPQSYLKLPLLKFEMLNMRSYPPEQFESNTDILMRNIKRKLHRLMKSFKGRFTKTQVRHYVKQFADRKFDLDLSDDDTQTGPTAGQSNIVDSDSELELLQDAKIVHSIPNRKTIKGDSARMLDEAARKSD